MFIRTRVVNVRAQHNGNVNARNRETKGIFQLHPSAHVSIQDARDAYDVYHYTHTSSITACPSYARLADEYAILGVDGEMVEEYIQIVETLEYCWNAPAKNI